MVLIFVVGVWGVVAHRNLVKKVVGLSIANSAIIMFFIYQGSLSGTGAPIAVDVTVRPVDPVPQALMLTAIVVGICVVALALVIVYRLYKRFGTLDMEEIERSVWKRGDGT
jgi:multicomponent Na+:H+ antiporter subunit C